MSRSCVTAAQGCVRREFILSIRECIRRDVERLNRIDKRLYDSVMSYTTDDVVDEFNRYAQECSLFNFMEGVIVKLRQNGKVRTSETYRATLNSFRNFLAEYVSKDDFRGCEDIMPDCLDCETVEAYEALHKGRGVTPNTISFYTGILRAVYYR